MYSTMPEDLTLRALRPDWGTSPRFATRWGPGFLAWLSPSDWAQPDPPLSARAPTRVEYITAREAADRPPKLTAIDFMRLTLPFLSRWLLERLYETLRTCKQMTNTNAKISTGIEFSPAAGQRAGHSIFRSLAMHARQADDHKERAVRSNRTQRMRHP